MIKILSNAETSPEFFESQCSRLCCYWTNRIWSSLNTEFNGCSLWAKTFLRVFLWVPAIKIILNAESSPDFFESQCSRLYSVWTHCIWSSVNTDFNGCCLWVTTFLRVCLWVPAIKIILNAESSPGVLLWFTIFPNMFFFEYVQLNFAWASNLILGVLF